jgi:hypothetical protein
MAEIRHAIATWSGDLLSGGGTIDYVSSGAFRVARLVGLAEAPRRQNVAERLLAAAHALL